jgi:6-phosphogluconolactonase (cycloisomerase 2 family)
MTRRIRIGAAALAASAAFAAAGTSAAGALAAVPSEHTVFVQTDNTAANQVVAYDRAADGSLSQAGVYATGGLGGALTGSVVDHLASQGALAYDRHNGFLYAVNAGSDTISVFTVSGDRLALRQVIGSGGSFPVSLAVSDGLLYVLNAREGGSVQGYSISRSGLTAIAGSTRALGLDATQTPEFTHTPGQLAFSPDGSQLLVTTKANGNAIDVFAVSRDGRLSGSPTVNPLPETVPFAVGFDQQGHLLVTEAGPNVLASFQLHRDGTIAQLDSLATGQAATCWIAQAGSFSYTSNAGSASLSGFRSINGGRLLEALGNTSTDAGTVDAAVSGNGRDLYVQAGAAGKLDEFAIGAHGALSQIGTVTVPDAVGGEGIVAG